VAPKSVPLNNSGSASANASAYAAQSPKFRPAGWRPLPKRANASRAIGLVAVERNNGGFDRFHQPIYVFGSFEIISGDHNHGRFKLAHGRHKAKLISSDCLRKREVLGLVEENCDQRGGVDDHSNPASVEMAALVIAKDFIGRSLIEDFELFHIIHDDLNAAEKVIGFRTSTLASLALDLAPQNVGQDFGDALASPARQFAHEFFGFGILDVEGHHGLRLSLFFLYVFLLPFATLASK
jgi:hypothetical protein